MSYVVSCFTCHSAQGSTYYIQPLSDIYKERLWTAATRARAAMDLSRVECFVLNTMMIPKVNKKRKTFINKKVGQHRIQDRKGQREIPMPKEGFKKSRQL